jgi:hypothetical protein
MGRYRRLAVRYERREDIHSRSPHSAAAIIGREPERQYCWALALLNSSCGFGEEHEVVGRTRRTSSRAWERCRGRSG